MEFFDVLVRYEVALRSVIDQELGRQDRLRLADLHAMRIVARYDGRARVQELSDDIGITVGAASKLVDRLERDGLAARSPHPDDRRSSVIALTAAGEGALVAALAVFRSVVDGAVRGESLEMLTAALQRLMSRLDCSGGSVAA